MKAKNIVVALVLICFFSTESKAQDQCPSFKMGKKRIQLRFIPKMKKNEIIPKSKAYFNFNESPFSVLGKFDNKYDGNFFALGCEKKINKKVSLEFLVGYEHVSRYSFPDTLRYFYPSVDMTQYYHAHGSGSDSTASFYDQVISNNITTGLQYRYYFKKVFSGFYLGEEIRASFGRNMYIDNDINSENTNYGFQQNNLAFSTSTTIGYQLIAKKHYVFDLFVGIIFRQGLNLSKDYKDSNANDEGLLYKYPNTSSLNQNYAPSVITGFNFGYKF